MSPSERTAGLHRLTLPTAWGAAVTVFDGRDELRYQGCEERELDLPAGLYVVRVETLQGLVEQTVRLDRDVDLSGFLPPWSTPTLVEGASTTHEYFSGPAIQASRLVTARPVAGGGDARLFVVARVLDYHHAAAFGAPGMGLLLQDGEGHLLSPLRPEELFSQPQGLVAFSCEVPGGTYRLATADTPARSLPLQLLPGWQTQVFVPVGGSGPALGQARVLLSDHGSGFLPEDPVVGAVDLATAALASGGRMLPRTVLKQLVTDPPNPMLLLVAGHALAMAVAMARTSGARQDEVANAALRHCVRQLETSLPEWPDTIALSLAAAAAMGRPLPRRSRGAGLPMVRQGFLALVRAMAADEQGPLTSSRIDEVSRALLHDSVWTTWGEPSAAKSPHSRRRRRGPERFGGSARPPVDAPDWIQYGILTELERQVRGAKWRGHQAAPPLALHVGALAERLGTTPALIQEAVAALDGSEPEALRRELQGGFVTLLGLFNESGNLHLSELLTAKPAVPKLTGFPEG